MNKTLLAGALAAGMALQACTGHTGGMLPTAPAASNTLSNPDAAATTGAGTTHAITIHGVAPSGFAYTATDRVRPANAADHGPVAATQPLTVRVSLQLRNVEALHQLIASHQVVSRDEFVARFAPTPADVQKVVAYLQAHKFGSVTVEPNRLIVSATGTALAAETAFRTSIHAFARAGKNLYANVTPAFVPKALGGTVLAVTGLNNTTSFVLPPMQEQKLSSKPAPRPAATTSPSPCSLYGLEILAFPSPEPEPDPQAGCLRTYYPADFQRAYDTNATTSAKSVNIAIIVEGSVSQSISDLRTNEQADLLPQVPVVVKQVGAASTDTSGDDEWTLDMTASSGIAQQVKTIYLYDTTSLTDSDITLAYSKWVSDDIAPIANSSFGGCEVDMYLDGSMVTMDELLNEGAAQGQTMFASSGDTGSYCPEGAGENGVPAGVPMVNYPAASPYVTAVGGTTLVTQSDGSYQGEASWYSGGGGLSQFEYAPTWEASAQPVASEGESFRGVPDIAMDADLQTGMNLYLTDASGWTVIGGTSLASPLAAGSWARVVQLHGKQFAPPLLYAAYGATTAGSQQTGPPPWQPHGPFHDVLAGGNGLYTALPGYDYTTGLGSLDVTLLTQAIP